MKPWQAVLHFDDLFAFKALIKQIRHLAINEEMSYYGFLERKVKIRRITSMRYLLTSLSIGALEHSIHYDNGLKFREVEFMSTVLKPITKHTHSYQKTNSKSDTWDAQFYKCTAPDCRHYIKAEFIEGKRCECVKCRSSFIVSKQQLWQRNKFLICLMCSKSPKKETATVVSAAFSDLMSELEDKEQKLERG